MIEGKAIYSILSTDTDVNALVSGRIYPQIGKQGADIPFIVYVMEDVEPSDTKSGVSLLDEVSYDIVCVGKTYAEVADLTEKVRTALDRKTAGTYAGVELDSIQFVDIDSEIDVENELHLTSTEYILRVKR